MLVVIDYGDGVVEEFESTSRNFDHIIPDGHAGRVEKVSSIIGAAMIRRAFLKGLAGLGPNELLDSEHSHHEEYKQHLRNLADIPYDGYHTDYTQWAFEFDNHQIDTPLS